MTKEGKCNEKIEAKIYKEVGQEEAKGETR
jgi:hypothetical protein